MSQLLWFPHSIAIALTHSVYIFEKMYVGTIIKVHFPPQDLDQSLFGRDHFVPTNGVALLSSTLNYKVIVSNVSPWEGSSDKW